MTALVNYQIVLNRRPVGEPTPEDFRMVEQPMPTPGPDEVLLKVLYLSIDPYMRGRMSDAESYATPVPLNGVMVGGTVARVEVSNHPNFQAGDLVLSMSGWQSYAVAHGSHLTKLGNTLPRPSYALGLLGMPGITAYMGLLDIGQPKAGETVVVASASGAVGSMVGQIAKLQGCRVVGIAGGDKKCRYVTEELGFDVCLDHRAPDFAQQLAQACPDGIDVYFENVGGAVFDAVMPLLNPKARIPVCGLISQYNATSLPGGPDRLSLLARTILVKRIRMQGFIVFDDYWHRYGEFFQQMSQWVAEGKVKLLEDCVEGLENAPQALIGLLRGDNFGKVVVQVARDL
ncbi:hypothetical protein HNQ59_001892 [Chitinivorax tropicus]|uniref:Enoyl reductase (ER) domain-containing protein n=1 Tax=Chitinivorax tropicus TaxID=714531 RepID=A0A840MTS8_9PROT|nr:NADP-dependent oxidoreductase [Chitinivorax tropicus]MBB5018601.1 hypothetical protein [Chitinivorax tropicus]